MGNIPCRAAHAALRFIDRIRRCVELPQTRLLLNALVLSRIDYCSSILFSLPDKHLNLLRRIIHFAARLVYMKTRRDSVEPLLLSLGWKDLNERLSTKIESMVLLTVSAEAPTYMRELTASPYQHTRTLRSAD